MGMFCLFCLVGWLVDGWMDEWMDASIIYMIFLGGGRGGLERKGKERKGREEGGEKDIGYLTRVLGGGFRSCEREHLHLHLLIR